MNLEGKRNQPKIERQRRKFQQSSVILSAVFFQANLGHKESKLCIQCLFRRKTLICCLCMLLCVLILIYWYKILTVESFWQQLVVLLPVTFRHSVISVCSASKCGSDKPEFQVLSIYSWRRAFNKTAQVLMCSKKSIW